MNTVYFFLISHPHVFVLIWISQEKMLRFTTSTMKFTLIIRDTNNLGSIARIHFAKMYLINCCSNLVSTGSSFQIKLSLCWWSSLLQWSGCLSEDGFRASMSYMFNLLTWWTIVILKKNKVCFNVHLTFSVYKQVTVMTYLKVSKNLCSILGLRKSDGRIWLI